MNTIVGSAVFTAILTGQIVVANGIVLKNLQKLYISLGPVILDGPACSALTSGERIRLLVPVCLTVGVLCRGTSFSLPVLFSFSSSLRKGRRLWEQNGVGKWRTATKNSNSETDGYQKPISFTRGNGWTGRAKEYQGFRPDSSGLG